MELNTQTEKLGDIVDTSPPSQITESVFAECPVSESALQEKPSAYECLSFDDYASQIEFCLKEIEARLLCATRAYEFVKNNSIFKENELAAKSVVSLAHDSRRVRDGAFSLQWTSDRILHPYCMNLNVQGNDDYCPFVVLPRTRVDEFCSAVAKLVKIHRRDMIITHKGRVLKPKDYIPFPNEENRLYISRKVYESEDFVGLIDGTREQTQEAWRAFYDQYHRTPGSENVGALNKYINTGIMDMKLPVNYLY